MARNVLVTGGADSVGRVVAEAFLMRGDRVHICDIREPVLQATLLANPAMRGTVADVADAAAVERVFAEACACHGEIAVLVNNAGIAGPRAAIEDIGCAEWDRTIAVNLNGMFHCMRHAIPGMKRRGGGAIINISSASTRTRLPLRTAYVVSKAAVEALTLNAARELGPFGIRCNAVLPGMIDNARMDGIVRANALSSGRTPEQVEADYLRYVSMRTKIEPAEIAGTVLFLASDAARKITGELIAVSGNMEWEI